MTEEELADFSGRAMVESTLGEMLAEGRTRFVASVMGNRPVFCAW